jgi:hypothetical protein
MGDAAYAAKPSARRRAPAFVGGSARIRNNLNQAPNPAFNPAIAAAYSRLSRATNSAVLGTS